MTGALHNGYSPAQGYETYAFENFGFACIFWGLLVACKAGDKAVLTFDLIWNLFWAGSLGLACAGKPWRAASAVPDAAAWAVVPVVAHALFAVFDQININAIARGKAKSS